MEYKITKFWWGGWRRKFIQYTGNRNLGTLSCFSCCFWDCAHGIDTKTQNNPVKYPNLTDECYTEIKQWCHQGSNLLPPYSQSSKLNIDILSLLIRSNNNDQNINTRTDNHRAQNKEGVIEANKLVTFNMDDVWWYPLYGRSCNILLYLILLVISNGLNNISSRHSINSIYVPLPSTSVYIIIW